MSDDLVLTEIDYRSKGPHFGIAASASFLVPEMIDFEHFDHETQRGKAHCIKAGVLLWEGGGVGWGLAGKISFKNCFYFGIYPSSIHTFRKSTYAS